MSFPAQRQDGQPGLEHLMVPRPVSVSPSYKPSGKLKGKVALVTGGDSGIGRAVCYHFALEGATVAFTYVSPQEDADAEETLDKLANEYKSPDARNPIKVPVTDLGYDQNCKKVVDEVVQAYGSIDILVNCAAEAHVVQKIEDLEPQQLENTFRTNVFSQFFMASHAVKHLGEGSCIINSLSRQAYLGNPIMLDYSSSKGAILTFTRGLASQLVRRGIRVNGVAPGPIWTPLNVTLYEENEVAHIGENAPMGRAGQPSEVAPSYVFLASEDASYTTGQVLHPNENRILSKWGIEPTFKVVKPKCSRWQPPKEPWIKINFDGATKGNPGDAGGGGICRDHIGSSIWAFVEFYDCQTNHYADMHAMLKALDLAMEGNIQRLVVEGDFEVVVNTLKDEALLDWRFQALFNDAKKIIKGLVDVRIRHTLREGNKPADFLANWGVRHRTGQVWKADFPRDLMVLIEKDRICNS